MDEPSPGGTSRVAKLLPKVGKRRWKKSPSRESFTSTASSDDAPRGRSPNSREPMHNGDDGHESASLLANEDDDAMLDEGDMSPIVYDEGGPSERSPVRPAVPSSHPSQIGQLTTSSPLIQADHLPEARNLDRLPRGSGLAHKTSFTASSNQARNDSPSKGGLEPPNKSARSRSRSPAGRIVDVFRSRRTQSNGPDEEAPEDEAPGTPRSEAVSSGTRPGNSKASSWESPTRPRPNSLNTSVPPRTPPSDEQATPIIVNTPPTPTNPATEHFSPPSKPNLPGIASNPNVVVSPSGNMISHRRLRSGSGSSIGPSKLSNITPAPLTPTPENGPTTPGTTGFFSSMFSAAQNAANTLSSTITNSNASPGGKLKTGDKPPSVAEEDESVEVTPSDEASEETNMADKELAVKTLGMGDLSLSQLGIQDTSDTVTPTANKFSDLSTENRARSESAPADTASTPVTSDHILDDIGISRPKSLYDPQSQAEQTPPSSVYEGKAGLQRSASIRSAIGRRRNRGSTGGTAGTTIGAAIAAAHSSVAHPAAGGSTPKLTGFAVASKKRNRDFHTLFKSVPDDDYLIEDYSCALQREILVHGRLYVSEGHLCFNSNIFGWVTTLVMSFDEIVSVEKRSTALVFKNGLMISTLHAKHVFASFTSRDSTYDLIINIWKLGHPTLRSSVNGVSIDETGGDKTEKVDAADGMVGGSQSSDSDEEESEDGEDVYDEDEEDGDVPEIPQISDSKPTDADGEKTVTRKASGTANGNGNSEKPNDASASSPGIVDYPGPVSHAPTDCGDSESHFERFLADEVIAAPLGKVYNYMFGPMSVTWMTKWLTGEQKCTEFQMDDKKGLGADNKSRGYSYVKPLYASIGPKQTRCINTETLEHFDLEKSVNVLTSTQTPDVPSGNVFSVKTKYCLSWAEGNATRIQVSCTIEWTGKSWLKGPIEKGANDGQKDYCRDIFAALKTAVGSRPRSSTQTNGATTKGGKKKKAKGKLLEASQENLKDTAGSTASKKENWGILEPLHKIVGPVVDIVKPVMTGNVVYGLLVGLLVATWFGFGLNGKASSSYGRDMGLYGYPQRLAAYEEMWRREETDLWDWLEERVGLHRMHEDAVPVKKRVVEPRTVEDKLREERMTDREVEEAIRITEEKLEVLKSVMDKKRVASPRAGSSSKVLETAA